MSFIRRRYYTWLFKAYFRRWNKSILFSLLFGAGIFFLGIFILNFYVFPILQKKTQKIGYVGTYTINSIPQELLRDVSYGLTRVNDDGGIDPAASFRWEIKNDGKEYIFYIKKGQYFHNNKELTAKTLNINFQDVEKEILDDYTVKLVLSQPYSPFLTSVSTPIFDENFSGLGDYEVKDLQLNAGFVQSFILQNTKDSSIKKYITFYPTEVALKTAYSLGEVDSIYGVNNLEINDLNLNNWQNTDIKRTADYRRLVTLFYNNEDNNLSNKKLRQALNYAIPEVFASGERAFAPIPESSIYFTESLNHGLTDIDIAKELLQDDEELLNQTYIISTLKEFESLAKIIADEWRKIGINAEINVIHDLSRDFQILLYPINLPLDPDQYILWHSSQGNNVSRYKSLRIDKLLEDGRSTSDTEERKTIYADFLKYIIDDVPASFLYFPYSYTVTRK